MNNLLIIAALLFLVGLLVDGFPVRTSYPNNKLSAPSSTSSPSYSSKANPFIYPKQNTKSAAFFQLSARKGDEDEDDDEEDIELLLGEDQDWRDFRAKLVKSESIAAAPSPPPTSEAVLAEEGDLDGIGSIFQDVPLTTATTSDTPFVSQEGVQLTPLEPSQWAYDAQKVIEQGSVILGGVEQEFGFGLRQQYFHKAAILVLDHEENTFTKGIILNRPTDLTLEDDINEGVKWRIWFGGVSHS